MGRVEIAQSKNIGKEKGEEEVKEKKKKNLIDGVSFSGKWNNLLTTTPSLSVRRRRLHDSWKKKAVKQSEIITPITFLIPLNTTTKEKTRKPPGKKNRQ